MISPVVEILYEAFIALTPGNFWEVILRMPLEALLELLRSAGL